MELNETAVTGIFHKTARGKGDSQGSQTKPARGVYWKGQQQAGDGLAAQR